MFKRFFVMMVLLTAILLSGYGCVDGSSGASDSIDLSSLAGTNFQVVTTQGGGSASYAIIAEDGTVYENLYVWDNTDLALATGTDSIFVYGRYGLDWMTRFDLSNPTKPIFSEFKTDENWEATGNPREVTIITDDVGYVWRYYSPIAWIIDPSPADQDHFKIGEIYLFDYMTNGNVPNPLQTIISGTTMYVLLERSNGAMYDEAPMLVAYDISTPEVPVVVGELALITRGVFSMVLSGTDIYVASSGDNGFTSGTVLATGGVEKIDISSGPGSMGASRYKRTTCGWIGGIKKQNPARR